VYDGLNPYADFDGQGNLTRRYLYGPAVDMIMAGLAEAEGVRWYLSDHLGTVRDLADAAGEVIDHLAYDAFGNVLAESNPAAGDRFRFTGREFDAAHNKTRLPGLIADAFAGSLGKGDEDKVVNSGGMTIRVPAKVQVEFKVD